MESERWERWDRWDEDNLKVKLFMSKIKWQGPIQVMIIREEQSANRARKTEAGGRRRTHYVWLRNGVTWAFERLDSGRHLPKSECLEEISRKVRSFRQARNDGKEMALCNLRNNADENCTIHNMQPSLLIRQYIRKSTDIFKYMEHEIAGSPPEQNTYHWERHALFALIIHTRSLKDCCSSPSRLL